MQQMFTDNQMNSNYAAETQTLPFYNMPPLQGCKLNSVELMSVVSVCHKF